ncbi:MAG: DNA methylase [Magnetococcales bacterium]|nr:DNA methylase [Magnetococcales bacterium]MBF0115191.1 DNA methylase [Magnetococcales bacterium]
MGDLFANVAFDDPQSSGPVECLGLTFESDAARRAFFLDKLRKKLQDPAFRQIEGFPIGTDADILALSDPPYYTACPNPFLEDFVRLHGKPWDPTVPYHKEPFAADVSEGKTDPIYNAHSYHTKVPHKAIMRYILHYTEPGDLVFDGFCGTGMTGVAARMCGTLPPKARQEMETQSLQDGQGKLVWGTRRAVVNDLSPIATFISANYNLPFDVPAFAKAGEKILNELEQELGWMYETRHTDGRVGRIEYTVWSEVYLCPDCNSEVCFLDEALDKESKRVKESFPCPGCGAILTKSRMTRLTETRHDPALHTMVSQPRRKPSLIVYKVGGKRFEKQPDTEDLAVLQRISDLPLPSELPKNAFPFDEMWEAPRLKLRGITHVHHLFLPRAGHALTTIWSKANTNPNPRIRNILLFFVEQGFWSASLCNSYRPSGYSQVSQYMKGVYYVPSQHSELSPWYILEGKLERLVKVFSENNHIAIRKISENNSVCVTTGSTTRISLPDNCIDYIFTDPPFGDNFPYAELNFLMESWHRVLTNPTPEAIVDRSKQNKSAQKDLFDYQKLMRVCLAEYHRILKPGRWLTVEFSNTKASVWNAIQSAIQSAGFVIANVSALDKQQGSFKAVTTTTAVKQDLVISAYKPNGGLENRFTQTATTEEGVWDFIRTHLGYLTIVKVKEEELDFIPERDPRILFDQVVAWYVRHSFDVPISSAEFQEGLYQRFPVRDGMVFLDSQVAEYDRAREKAKAPPENPLFVTDERSAIDWLRQFLKRRPSTYQEIHTEFLQQLNISWKNHETRPELEELLVQNFLQYDGRGEVPAQIHAYLATNYKPLRNLEKSAPDLQATAKECWYVPDPNKAIDLEKLRERTLLKEFESYREAKQRRLKIFRLEAVRAGFKKAWQTRDFATIVEVAKKIPDEVLQEDPKLIMWYDQAVNRVEEDGHA